MRNFPLSATRRLHVCMSRNGSISSSFSTTQVSKSSSSSSTPPVLSQLIKLLKYWFVVVVVLAVMVATAQAQLGRAWKNQSRYHQEQHAMALVSPPCHQLHLLLRLIE